MSASRQTKYALANLGLGVLFFLAFRFYSGVNAHPPQNEEQVRRLVLIAVVLYITAGIVITVRAYYRAIRFNGLDQSEKAAGLHAYGALAADRMKKITMNLAVTKHEYEVLQETGSLVLAPEHFNMPVRIGDTVHVQFNTDRYTQQASALVAKIDGVNRQIILRRKNA